MWWNTFQHLKSSQPISIKKMPTKSYLGRLADLSNGNDALLQTWKKAAKWAKDRANDHTVHVMMPDGSEQSKLLFETYKLEWANRYDDDSLREVIEWFAFARAQYESFF